ncbi:MAG: ribose-5-phosphate isomerase RpiA [Deferrisomatales bacterium]
MDKERERRKRLAAERAVDLVEPGMIVGLGHGSTALLALRRLAERLRAGRLRGVAGVPCSTYVESEALRLGVPLTTLDAHPEVDLTIDGADEVSPSLDLVKGAGGALLREKIVAQVSRREVIVVDDAKLSPALGTRCPVPVEVVPFGCRPQIAFLESLGARVRARKVDPRTLQLTDQGNLILDCDFGPIEDPPALAARLDARAGVVGHGLFLGLATDVLVAGADGVRHLRRPPAPEPAATPPIGPRPPGA